MSDAYHRITDTLNKLYGPNLFERNGIRHPIIVYRPDEEQIGDVDSVLASVSEHSVKTFPFYDWAYLHTMQNAGRNLFNGTTFAFNKLRKSPLKIWAYPGKYYDMLATCGALEHELRAAAETNLIRLPLRTQLHRYHTAREVLRNGHGRSAAIGVATLTVFNRDGSYQALLEQRSRDAATDPLFYHLVPAFIFQPSGEIFRHPQEWSVSHQIYREFLEELFGLPEVSAPERPDYFYDHPALVDLRQMMAIGQAALYLTGIAMNLLTLRPEICALLLIHDPHWRRRMLTTVNAAEMDKGQLVYAPIKTDESLLSALPPNPHLTMPPQAVAGLWLGVDLARVILTGQNRHSLPEWWVE